MTKPQKQILILNYESSHGTVDGKFKYIFSKRNNKIFTNKSVHKFIFLINKKEYKRNYFMKMGQQKDPWLSSLINYTNETKKKDKQQQ